MVKLPRKETGKSRRQGRPRKCVDHETQTEKKDLKKDFSCQKKVEGKYLLFTCLLKQHILSAVFQSDPHRRFSIGERSHVPCAFLFITLSSIVIGYFVAIPVVPALEQAPAAPKFYHQSRDPLLSSANGTNNRK